MPTTFFRMAEGVRTANRTVQGVSGGGFVRINTALATPSNGDIVEIFTGGLSGNMGFYTLVNFSGGTGGLGLYVRPAPNIQVAAGGSIARLNRAPFRTGSVNISGVVALSGEDNLALVWAPGANFLNNGVMRNDRAAISGSSISGNMGGWYVHQVLTEDKLILRPPDRGAGLETESPGTGTIRVRQGFHVVQSIISEDEGLTWATYGVSGILPVSGASLFQGSGELRNYTQVVTGGTGTLARTHIRIQGISKFILNVSGLSGAKWTAKNESLSIPSVNGISLTLGDAHEFRMTTQSGNAVRPLIISLGVPVFIGNNPASGAVDRYSVTSGSSWVGFAIPDIDTLNVVPQFHGSYYDGADSINYLLASGTSGVASIFRGNALNPPTGFLSESLVSYGAFGVIPVGIPDIQNLLIPSTTAPGAISTPGMILEGLILGSGVSAPLAPTTFTEGDPAIILNPRVDLDLFHYFYLFAAGGSMEKHYTFSPRYRSADGGDPISGLTVQIYEISDLDGESLFLTDMTDVNGRIGGGAGYDLRVQRMEGDTGYGGGQANATKISFTYRVVVQGGGYRLTQTNYTITEKFVQDVTVQHISPDYEGEYDE